MFKIKTPIIVFGFSMLLATIMLPNASAMSMSEKARNEKQAELDKQCETARAEKLKPIRQKLVKECMREWGKEKSECERFYRDYGDAVRLANGEMRPELFLDLPECVKAFNFQRSYREP